MTVLKYVLLAGLAILLMNYAHAAYEQRKLRKTLLGLRFMRHAVERRAASELTALQRIAQEPQLVVRHFASEFTVHSSLKTGDEILVGRPARVRPAVARAASLLSAAHSCATVLVG